MSEQQQADLDAMLRQAPVDFRGEVTALRAGFEEVMQRIPVPDDVRRVETSVGGVDAIEVTIEGIDPVGTILYFHGGVYVIGSANASMPLVADLARRTRAKVVSVNYRLAPENPHPAAVEDATAVYEGLLSQGSDPGSLAFSGESAGGGLAVAALVALRDAETPLPASAFVMSPWVDLTVSGGSITDKQDVDPLLTGEGLRWGVSNYVADADPTEPSISPIFANLNGLPPLLIQVGSHEILLSDALRLAEQAATSDVAVTLEVVPGVPHVFQAYAAVLDEGDAALLRAANFVQAHFVVTRPSVRSQDV
jgi:acetyl esterase/lipase